MADKKKIIERVLERKAEMTSGPNKATVAKDNQDKAVAAIIGGIKSPAWREYMKQFADPSDTSQLKRLLATDGTENHAGLNLKRAYLVSEGTCGEGTGHFFGNEVDTIDDPVA